MILDGGALSQQLYGETLDPRSFLVRFYPEAEAVVPPLDHAVLTGTPLVARVNHGKWLASCPCGARGLPSPGCVVFLDRLLGWCPHCGNGATGRGWRPIVAPPPEQRARIEAVLLCRPNVEDRNWEPTETVADLLAQNLEHGDPVPTVPGPVLGPHWRERVAAFSRLPRVAESMRRRLLRKIGRRR